MDVRMPDGTIVKGVPKGITKEDLTDRLAAMRIAKAQGVNANDVLARLKNNKGQDLSGFDIAKNVVTDTATNALDAVKASGPGLVNFARGQLKTALEGQNIPTPLTQPIIPQRDSNAALGFRMESPLNLGRQALSRATGTQDVIGDTIGGLGMQIDESNRQFDAGSPTIAEHVGRLAPSAAALFALRDKTSINRLTKIAPKIFDGKSFPEIKKIIDATKALERSGIVLKSGIFGATAGGVTPRGENDGLVSNTAIGGAGGLTVGAGLKGLGAVANVFTPKGREAFVARRVASQLGTKEKFDTPQAITNVQRFKAAGIKDPSLSGLTGSSRVAVGESAAKSLDPDAAAVSEGIIRGNVLKRINSIVDKFDPRRLSESKAAEVMFKAIDGGVKNLRAVRSSIFDKGFSAARRATGDKKVIDSRHLRAAIDGRIAKIEGSAKGEQELADIKSLSNFEKQIARFRKLSVEDLQNLLSSAGRQASGGGKIIGDMKTEAARNTKSFVFGELKDLLKNISSDKRAFGTFLKARDAYSRITTRIKSFQNTDTGKVIDSKFGLKGKIDRGDIDKMIKAVNKADPEELKVIVPMLKRFNPEAHGALIRTFWRELATKSRPDVAGPGKTGTVDVDKLLKNLLSEGQKKRFTSVFSKGERREIVQFAKGYRDLINRAKGNEDFVSKARDVGGFLAATFPKNLGPGQMAIFIMRFLAKGFSEKQFTRLMLSKSGKQAVIKASKLRPGSPEWARLLGVVGKESGLIAKKKTKQLRENNGN